MGASEKFLGNIEHRSIYSKIGFGVGAGASVLAGMYLGTTEVRAAKGACSVLKTGWRFLNRGYQTYKTLSESKIVPIAKDSSPTVKNIADVAKRNGIGAPKENLLNLDKLSEAGKVLDRAGLTRAGRALDKHGNRAGSPFPKATGDSTMKNRQGQFQLDDILTNPGSIVKMSNRPRYGGGVIDIKITGDRGLRYTKEGEFVGFLNP